MRECRKFVWGPALVRVSKAVTPRVTFSVTFQLKKITLEKISGMVIRENTLLLVNYQNTE